MSLFGSIQLSANTLRAMQIGLQVVGNNIANANTPGFIREEVLYTPAPVQEVGGVQLGLGVRIDGIVQKVDRFLQERLLGARSDRASAEVREKSYQDLEVLIGELSDTDLSTSFSGFFNSIDEILLNPGDVSVRNLVVLKGHTLAQDFNRLDSRVRNIRESLNSRVVDIAGELNNLTEQIRILNIRIAEAEGGDPSSSDAGGLRDQRQVVVDRLSQLIDVRVNEQPSGGLTISVGGELLVFEGQRRSVQVALSPDRGLQIATVQWTDTQSPLQLTAGELQGLYSARDDIIGGFLDGLDELAATLAFEFNKIHTQGQGLIGFRQLTSSVSVSDANAALDAAGLTFLPTSGVFDLLVRNTNSDETTTRTIQVNLDGLNEDTSLNDLAAQLDAVDGIVASVSSLGQLTITAESQDTEFAFDGDTSGVLAALGLNTFFTGSTARDIGVNEMLEDERLFAASARGIDFDTRNAERLAVFLDSPLDTADGKSFIDLYGQLVSDVTQGSAISQSVADGLRVFESTLDGQNQAISGVNIDEEAIRMILLQRAFQAAARHIQTVSEMLEVLVNL
jgi:flagellar hook-associated protein 1 FlgK